MPRHYQPTTRPLLPVVVAPLPNYAAGLTNVGAPAVRLRYAKPDFVNQVRPTLATLPNFASELTKPAPPIVKFRYEPPSFIAPPKFNLVQAATPTVAAWSPTIGRPQIDLQYAKPDVTGPFTVTTVLANIVAGLADAAQQAVELVYKGCAFDSQVNPTLATLPTYLDPTLGAQAQQQGYAQANVAAPSAVAAATTTPFVQTDTGRLALAVRYTVSDFVTAVLANIPPLLVPQQAEPGRPAVGLKYAVADFVSAIRANIVPLLVPMISEPALKALPQRYVIADFLSQIAPTLATLPTLLFGIAEPGPQALPQKYAGASYSAPDKFNILAAAQTFLPGWLSTDGKLAVVLKYLQGEPWVGQVNPTLATLPTLLHGLVEVMRPANPPKFLQALPFTAPDKFNLVAATQTFLPGWLSSTATPTVIARYVLPEALLKPLAVLTIAVSRTLGTPHEALGVVASSPTTNYEILAKLLAAFGVPNEVLGSRASAKGSQQEALGTRQSTKAETYEAKGTVTGVRGHNQEAKGLVATLARTAYEILTTVSPRQAKSAYEVLRGVAQGKGGQQEASGKVFSLPSMPYEVISAIFNPVALLGGKVFPVVGVLTGKVVQQIGVASGAVTHPVGVLAGKIVQGITVVTGKVLHALGIQSGKIVN